MPRTGGFRSGCGLLPPLLLLGATAVGCGTASSAGHGSAAAAHRPPPTPCASRTATPSPRPTPYAVKLAWRAEEMPDGSLQMTGET